MALFKEVIGNRKLLLRLSVNDFKTRYAGNYLGIIWAFIQPVITVLVYWFVFEVGFKDPNSTAPYPFLLYLLSGIVPWFFFQDSLIAGTNCFIEYSYLVKKVVFKISILPIVKIISALFVHVFFVSFMIFIFALYGRYPDIYVLQVFYYSFCMFAFSVGCVYLTSAVVIFFRDLSQVISIFLQVGIWLTPIMWEVTRLGDKQFIMKFNPIFYVVNGYRDAFLNKIWFFERAKMSIYFWAVTIILFIIGTTVYKKLRVHFADVL